MKLLVYLLSTLLIVSSVKSQDNSSTVNRQDLDVSSLTSEAVGGLKGGINYIFGRAAEKYGISNRDIDVTKINQAQEWVDNGDTYYFFNVEAQNADAWINATYTVKAQDDGGFKVVNEWNYTIERKNENEDDLSGNFEDNEGNNEDNIEFELELEFVEEFANTCEQGEEVDPFEINSNVNLRDGLSYGMQWIFEKAKNKFDVDNSQITVNQIDQICKWQKNGNNYYHFEAKATNAEDDTVDAKFNVQQGKEGGFRIVNEWSYDVNSASDKQEDLNDGETDLPDDNIDVFQDDPQEKLDAQVQFNTLL